MAGRGLTGRVDALEKESGCGSVGPAVWLRMKPSETNETARARYEAEHEPIGNRWVIAWRAVQPKAVAPCA